MYSLVASVPISWGFLSYYVIEVQSVPLEVQSKHHAMQYKSISALLHRPDSVLLEMY